MKFSSDLLKIFKNFSDINSNLLLKPGNVIKTVRVPPTIYAEAEVGEVFEDEFGIYDLKEFLSTLAMFKNPTIEFKDGYLEIVDDDDPTIRTKYYSADPTILTKVPELKQLPEPSAVFTITDVNFKRIQRASSTLKCPDVVIKGENGQINAIVCDLTTSTKNSFTVLLESDYQGATFDVHLKQEKLLMLDGDYKCSLIADKVIKMEHAEKKLSYVVSLDV